MLVPWRFLFTQADMRKFAMFAMCAAALTAVLGGFRTLAFASDAQWAHTCESGIFQVRAEFSLSDAASQRLLREIEQLQADVGNTLELDINSRPVQLNIFSGRWSYSRYVSARVPEGADRPALYVQGPDLGHVFVYRRWGFETDVRHECTHAVLHNSLPYVPLWLDEGFAEYFEVPSEDRPSDHPHLGSLKRALFFGWRPQLQRLEGLREMSEMGSREYQESWAWVHFMLHGPAEVQTALVDYVDTIQRGEFAGPLSERLPTLNGRSPESQLIEHLRHWD